MCLEKKILDKLSYSKCKCPIDYKENIGIVNGICPEHSQSKLLVDGVRIDIYQKLIKLETKKLARKPSEIV